MNDTIEKEVALAQTNKKTRRSISQSLNKVNFVEVEKDHSSVAKFKIPPNKNV